MVAFYRYLPAGLILTLGLGMTFIATAWVERWERLAQQSEWQKQTSNLTTALQRTLNRYNELLLSIGDLYDATDQPVDEQVFSRFVRRVVSTYPGIQALEWAPLVPHEQRASYEQWLQARTQQTQAKITERDRKDRLTVAASRDSYVPVTFLEPWQTNEVALGYDLASDQTRRVALERARDTGAIAATARVQLVQETANNQYSFLVFVPVYRQLASTPELRRQQIQGYILGVFRIADVVEESLSDLNDDIDFYLFDQTAQLSEQFLGFYNAQAQQVSPPPVTAEIATIESFCHSGLDCTQPLQLGQREWQIIFVPTAPRPWLRSALATLLIGCLTTATLLIYLSRWQAELRQTRELSELKLRLFSMASHELRTPLSVVSVSAQLLAAHGDRLSLQQQHHTLDRIQLAAKRMAQLVSDILTLARAEAGKLEFNPEIVSLAAFCQQLFEQIQLQPKQTLVLENHLIHEQAYLDKKLLHAILTNLLANAAKYSAPGSQICLAIAEVGETLQFQVIDSGIGIPAEAQDQIFTAFYRGGNVGQTPGIGLGLAVVKTCVELHGGQLSLSSTPQTGTCITVTLPRIE
ncbi:MAG: CHASE domain-containing protein [Almyronema sp.]